MKILYLDSEYLSFEFEKVNGVHTIDSVPNFSTIAQAKNYFFRKFEYDLILYNPYIFIHLIENFNFEVDKFLLETQITCIPYTHPKHILPLSRKIENKLTSLFPLEKEKEEPNFTSEYKNKCVLVTGAGGSIGSELVIQLLKNEVKTCLCLDLSEFSIFTLKQKLSNLNFKNFEVILGSYGDKNTLSSIFSKHKVDIIINASAYKHVSIMQENPHAAINNNILNFIELLKTAHSFGVADIVQISTDKAALPSNVMGFSKLLCEQILIHTQTYLGMKFNYSIVRFGNVVGSSGSVIPIFIENLKEGKKLSVTDREVERYIMQIRDAVSLVLRAASFRTNKTFILDMGSPYKILNLAIKTLKNTQFFYDQDLVELTGLQNGEKLTEVLYTPSELKVISEEEDMFVIGVRNDAILTKSEMKLLLAGDLTFLAEKIRLYT